MKPIYGTLEVAFQKEAMPIGLSLSESPTLAPASEIFY